MPTAMPADPFNQKVWQPAWQHYRLLQAVVEVGHEVDGFFIKVPSAYVLR
jgi:hypothetical protein